MDTIKQVLDLFLHLQDHLHHLTREHGAWIYGILFLIIFAETGLVVTPFLPGDSLLFVAGTLAATGAMDVHALFAVLALASFLGDNTNHWIGRFLGPKVFSRPDSLLFNRAYLDRTHAFYEKHGATTIVIARFMPIVRTFAPFVAGVGAMSYGRFLCYNVVGGVVWVVSLVLAGYRFSKLSWVRDNFSVVILAIIFISVLPGLVEFWRARRQLRHSSRTHSAAN